LTSDLDSNLTQLGKDQAEAAADALAAMRIDEDRSRVVLFVSPFRRTLQTCKPIAERLALPAHVRPDICEYIARENEGYNTFAGLSRDEMTRDYPFVRLDEHAAVEDRWWPAELEDATAIFARAARVRDMLYERYAGTGATVLLVSHAEPLGRLVEAMLRVDPADGWPPWHENCGLSRLIVGDPNAPADVVALNDLSHLQSRGLVSPVRP
jgi:broad specificity phosphatase PhoE